MRNALSLAFSSAGTQLSPSLQQQAAAVGSEWESWVGEYFADYVRAPMAPRHRRLWGWFDALEVGARSRPLVEVWARGGGKSTAAELGCARVAAKLSRRFVLYVGARQDRADEHVQNVAGMLEHLGLGRALNEYGFSRGWRHNRLRTASGFNVIALGLDVVARGVKLDFYRPDLIIFDDIDGPDDTELTREKKIRGITTGILPTGAPELAVLVIQNLISRDSIVSQLVDGRADFLRDRIVTQPEPAVVDLTVEQEVTDDGARFVVTGGEPTWAGQGLETVEGQINTWGISAFLREAQHEVDDVEGGMWERQRDIEQWRVVQHPPLVAITVAIDPSATRGGDEAGIIVAGRSAARHGYLLADETVRGSPGTWAQRAVDAYRRLHATRMVAEANNGGEMVQVTFSTIKGAPTVHLVHASRGKATRAQPVQKLAQEGRLHHVGHFPALERELCTWKEGLPSPNRLDAFCWSITDLLLPEARPFKGASGPRPSVLSGGMR